jgi:acyl-lipid omega-6 desaturase (Delta-12 desaturase)
VPSPAELDRRAKDEGVTLAKMVAAIPRECYEVQPWKAWGGLARNLALIALFEVALYHITFVADRTLLWTLPATVTLWCLTAWAMGGVFLIGHDCGHMAFSKTRWVNTVVGHLCTSFFYASYTAWQIGHNKHHVDTNIRKVDTNWPENMPTVEEYRAAPAGKKLEALLAFGSPVGPIVGNVVGQTRYAFMPWTFAQIKLSRRDLRKLLFSNLFMWTCTFSLIAALWTWGGGWFAAKHYLIPVAIGFATAALFTLVQHSADDALVFDEADFTPFRGQVLSTFDVRFPWIVETLCMYITLHVVHHLTTRVPWYHLKRASAAIKATYPDYYQERRLTLGYLRRLWSCPVLQRDPERGFYVMAPVGGRPVPASPASAPKPIPTA